jgi:putative transcriptional regulator
MTLEALRKRAGLRVEQVAAQVGISHSTVHNWEKGRTIPKLRIDQFEELLSLYKCSFDDLTAAVRETNTANKEEAIALHVSKKKAIAS